jgi:hypothetical protein
MQTGTGAWAVDDGQPKRIRLFPHFCRHGVIELVDDEDDQFRTQWNPLMVIASFTPTPMAEALKTFVCEGSGKTIDFIATNDQHTHERLQITDSS